MISSPIDLVVELSKYVEERDAGRLEPLITEIKMLDYPLKKILVPVPTGTDPGLLVELVARTQINVNLENK
jgi:serine kinase of HPr protein (carbohydrate metabolism regulator)